MSVVFTVGYEGTDIDRFVATLKAAGVKKLADVRALPQSRKKGFSKRGLAERLATEGIEYEHYVQLGDPKPGREAARAGKYDVFRVVYNSHLETVDAQRSLLTLAASTRKLATCLLCFERDPKTCHRSIVAAAISAETGSKVFDLFADDPDRYIQHAAKIPRFVRGEYLAAAE